LDWCQWNKAPYRLIHEARRVTIPATSSHTKSYEYDTDPSIYAEITNARIVPGWDQILTPDGCVIADVSYSFRDRIKRPKAKASEAELLVPESGAALFYYGSTEKLISDDVFFLSAPYRDGSNHPHFGHWMIDFLPRLLAFELPESNKPWKIGVPDDISPKQIESITMMGFDEAQILKLRRDTRYLCRKLHVLKLGETMPPNPEFVHFLRSRLFTTSKEPRRGKYIYLERGEVITRLIANTAEFDALLDTYGFMRVDVAKLTMAEQQELLGDAEVLLGSFGSALLSVYFAPPGSVLIDIIGEHRADPTLPHTCYLIGVEHQFLTCKGAPPDQAKWWHVKEPDLLVDCAELERRLAALAR
jgi:hypothetical protein